MFWSFDPKPPKLRNGASFSTPNLANRCRRRKEGKEGERKERRRRKEGRKKKKERRKRMNERNKGKKKKEEIKGGVVGHSGRATLQRERKRESSWNQAVAKEREP